MTESGVIPPHGRLIGMVETDDGVLGIEVHGSGLRISGDAVLNDAERDQFFRLWCIAVDQAEATMLP